MVASTDFLAVPGEVTSSTADIWIGSTSSNPDHPGDVSIVHRSSGTTWPAGPWSSWTVPGDPAASIRYQRIGIKGLSSSTFYPLELTVAGQTIARASIRTLPDALPSVDQPPFIVLL